ncbi:acyl-CoA N-acyltransferase [Podospora didyma]|uniref:Acyl-CoA N-acyltransferase n=1 Tax=Podospora didyma TaxID=330526 RepID=A0AAE0K9Q2_9PEZI|nr:acyl-CoA N-acyltransferase [Podospora didyma]
MSTTPVTAPSPLPTASSSSFPPPILSLSKSTIRRIRPADAAALVKTANNPAVARSLRSTFPSPYTPADAEKWIAHCTAAPLPGYSFAICDAATDELIGGLSLRALTVDEAKTWEMGYYLAEPYWGRGIVSEAAAAFARWAFARWGEEELVRLEAGVYSSNPGSAKVLEKAGFVFEGRRRRAVVKRGEVLDVLMYGLTREDVKGET